MDISLFLTIDHMLEDLVCLLGLKVWFANLLSETICINMYLTFKMRKQNVLTHIQFDCTHYFIKKKTNY